MWKKYKVIKKDGELWERLKEKLKVILEKLLKWVSIVPLRIFRGTNEFKK